MCLILKDLHKYVPTEKVTLKLALPTGDFSYLTVKFSTKLGCEDFLTTVLHTHVISAANEILSENQQM